MKFKGTKILIFTIILYLVLYIFDNSNCLIAISKSLNALKKVAPFFLLIILISTLINYFLNPKKIIKHFGKESGKKAIFYSIVGGILSHGPMYAWYGILKDLKDSGLKEGLIATFLYARVIKIPLLPFMVDMFGWVFTIVINIYIILISIIQGVIIDKLQK